jgi:hypothetical protein
MEFMDEVVPELDELLLCDWQLDPASWRSDLRARITEQWPICRLHTQLTQLTQPVMGKHKLSSLSQVKTVNKLGKDVCGHCGKAPREGTYKKKGRDRPYTTCAACRVKPARIARLRGAATRPGRPRLPPLPGLAPRQPEPRQPGGQFAATATTPRRRPLVNQRASYPDPHLQYPCPDSGVVCVVEITAAFWVRYQHAYFNLGEPGIKIGQGGEVQ